ncbi:MAG: hypothetical protein KKG62_06675 [Actinobacteria bacterium]|nr:hypothetical protein [Actinomycetota bacterium]
MYFKEAESLVKKIVLLIRDSLSEPHVLEVIQKDSGINLKKLKVDRGVVRDNFLIVGS